MARIWSAIVCLHFLSTLSGTATAGFLSPATSSNVFALGSASISAGNIQGALTAGGDASLRAINVGSIYAQGDLTLIGGNVRGSVLYGGTFREVAGRIAGPIEQVSSPLIDFPAAAQSLTDASTFSATLPANGTASYDLFGNLLLTGTDPSLNIFDITPAFFGTTLAISAPAGSTVLVNLFGASPDIEFTDLNALSGSGQMFDPSNVLFNFPEATSLYLFGDTIAGTVLAPGADVMIYGSSVTGTLIANDLSAAAVNFHDSPFAGDLTPAGPVPSSVTLLGLGVASLLILGRLQRLAGNLLGIISPRLARSE